MPRIVTTLHDPAVLAATCRRLGLPAPAEQARDLGAEEVFGWVVHLPGLRSPVAWDALTGLVAYPPLDNAFARYACLMRFVYRCYDIQAAFRIDFPAWLGTRTERTGPASPPTPPTARPWPQHPPWLSSPPFPFGTRGDVHVLTPRVVESCAPHPDRSPQPFG
jgi:hypothetical protein